MKPSASEIYVGELQTAARTKELLETLELLSMSECMAQLRSAQRVMESVSIDAEIILERAAAIESESSRLVAISDKSLIEAKETRIEAATNAKRIIKNAEINAGEILESAMELADAHMRQQAVNRNAVDDWISEKAGQVASAAIADLESRVVEPGTISDVPPTGHAPTLRRAA